MAFIAFGFGPSHEESRPPKSKSSQDEIVFAAYRLDRWTKDVTVQQKAGERTERLSTAEGILFRALAEADGKTVSPEDLQAKLEDFFGHSMYGNGSNGLASHISRLRTKLRPLVGGNVIRTIRACGPNLLGGGYQGCVQGGAEAFGIGL